MHAHGRRQRDRDDGYYDDRPSSYSSHPPKQLSPKPASGDSRYASPPARSPAHDATMTSSSHHGRYSSGYEQQDAGGGWRRSPYGGARRQGRSGRSGSSSRCHRRRRSRSKYSPDGGQASASASASAAAGGYKSNDTERDRDYKASTRDKYSDRTSAEKKDDGERTRSGDSRKRNSSKSPKHYAGNSAEGEWTEHVSSSGKKFWYNAVSEVSQWEKPREWLEKRSKYYSSSSSSRTGHERRENRERESSRSEKGHRRSANSWRNNSRQQEYDESRSRVVAPTAAAASAAAVQQQQSIGVCRSHRRSNPSSSSSSSWRNAGRQQQEYDESRVRAANSGAFPSGTDELPPPVQQQQPPPNESSWNRNAGGATSAAAAAAPPEPKYNRIDNDPRTIAHSGALVSVGAPLPLSRIISHAATANGAASITSPPPSSSSLPPPLMLSSGANASAESLQQQQQQQQQQHHHHHHQQHHHHFTGPPTPTHSENHVDHPVVVEIPRRYDYGTYGSLVSTPGPVLTPSLSNYMRGDLLDHVTGWPADVLESSAQRFSDEANMMAKQVTRVSSELKVARSIVREREIKATLQEQKVMYLRHIISELEESMSQNSLMCDDLCQ